MSKREKFCHLSIDDVTKCFRYLSNHSNEVHTIFDEPFLGYLRYLHQRYHCRFTLYAYLQDGDFNLKDVPNKWKEEFVENSEWLKIGYHSVSRKPVGGGNIDSFETDYTKFEKAVKKFAGDIVLAKYLRLDFFQAEQEWIDFLRERGIKVLLSADDKRISYSLPEQENHILIEEGAINYHGMHYLRSDIRIERKSGMSRILQKSRNALPLVIFTHEWALGRKNRMILELFLMLLKKMKYKYICE